MESQKIWLALTSVVLLILVVLGAVQADQRLQKNDRVLRSQDVLQEAVPPFMEAGLREGLKRARLQIVPSASGDEKRGYAVRVFLADADRGGHRQRRY